MPGVVVSWSGKCRDHRAQEALCARLAEISAVSCQMIHDEFGADIAPIHYESGTRLEKALVRGLLFGEQSGPPWMEELEKGLFLMRNVRLYGLEFPLHDPRRFNSIMMRAHEYQLSFVFLRSDDPLLDGHMVQVHRVNPAHPLSSTAPFILSSPELDLRYYLENWTAELLGWVKRFFIPDLSYWVWRDNQGYEGYEQYAPDDQRARDEIFLYLCEAFIKEAADWRKYNKYQPVKGPPGEVIEVHLTGLEEDFDEQAREEKRQRSHDN